MQFNRDGNPTVSALYLVDRDKQGKYYRWFNAETDQWGMCGADMNEALDNKDKPSPVGFFPWVGPLTGKNFVPKSPVHVVDEDGKPTKKPAKKMAKQRTAVVAAPKAPKAPKSTHPDGTVWFLSLIHI